MKSVESQGECSRHHDPVRAKTDTKLRHTRDNEREHADRTLVRMHLVDMENG